jgi:hypothetical protein
VSPFTEAVITNRSLRGVVQVAYSFDGVRLASYGRDGKVIVRPASGGPALNESLLPKTDVVAVANPSLFPWVPVLSDPHPGRRTEIEILSSQTGESVAWAPGSMDCLRVHPGGRIVAGLQGEGFFLFQLEGADRS